MSSSGKALTVDATRIWRAGVAAADPLPLMQAVLGVDAGAVVVGQRRIRLDELEAISVVGAGKAGARMSRAVHTILGTDVLRGKRLHGWVNVPAAPARTRDRIHLHAARHGHENQPTRAGLVGTRRIVSILAQQGPRDLALCLISGGGSALLPAPPAGVGLREKRTITSRLHAVGASIDEVNTVRKHLSTVKGGGLLRAWRGRWLTSFVLSDVAGDDLSVVASGPTAPDPTTFGAAIEVLRRHALWDGAPRAVRDHLRQGHSGRRPETLKQMPPGAENVLIGGNRQALEGAAREARRLGYSVIEASAPYGGQAAQAGRDLARFGRNVRDRGEPAEAPVCLIAGGETTVSLGRGAGCGGRCQEAALAALDELQWDLQGIAILVAGTDGEDGPTDAAGAFIDEGVAKRARRLGLDLPSCLARHNAYPFFDRVGGLLRTGLTGTNVMDLAVVVIGSRRPPE
jgi:hydroxypyruvate reductase/glycerate 2-kinase